MTALVGYTGFVGSNLYAAGKDQIQHVYNSSNIEEAYGTSPDLLIYSGVRAEKYLANSNPSADLEHILQAQRNIESIAPKKLVLISTIDVFHSPRGKTEASPVDTDGLQPYGLHRYQLERWARKTYPQALILRLPALFGLHIKKNFIYDLIHPVPQMLKEELFGSLSSQAPVLQEFYSKGNQGFYKCRPLSPEEERRLRKELEGLHFTALNFTDSRNVYQFYPLARLWADLRTALKEDLRLWHPATEPVSAGEIYHYLTGREFVNHVVDSPAFYDYRTNYAQLFGKQGPYIMDKEEVLARIKAFVEEQL